MPNRIADLHDRFEIRELIDRYSYAVNERDFAAFGGCFTDDGIWDVGKPFEFRLEGRASIVDVARTKIVEMDFVIQTPHATVIWLDGDRARAHSTMWELVRGPQGASGLQMFGTYADQLVRVDGAWLFAHRVYRVTTIDMVPPAGDFLKVWSPW